MPNGIKPYFISWLHKCNREKQMGELTARSGQTDSKHTEKTPLPATVCRIRADLKFWVVSLCYSLFLCNFFVVAKYIFCHCIHYIYKKYKYLFINIRTYTIICKGSRWLKQILLFSFFHIVSWKLPGLHSQQHLWFSVFTSSFILKHSQLMPVQT